MRTNGCLLLAVQALVVVISTINAAATWPTPSRGQYDLTNFTFDSGEKLGAPLELHYQTLGQLRTVPDGSGRTNAVLIIHGTTQSSAQFFSELFAAQLFNRGQALDASKYFLVLPDGIGQGNSSKPSRASSHNSSSSSRNNSSNKTGGAIGMAFPKYQYSDMVRAYHDLLTEHLNVPHVRLVLGVYMGGMHAWMFGEKYPDFADALMPVASLPVAVGDQNWLYRKMIMVSPPQKTQNQKTKPSFIVAYSSLSDKWGNHSSLGEVANASDRDFEIGVSDGRPNVERRRIRSGPTTAHGAACWLLPSTTPVLKPRVHDAVVPDAGGRGRFRRRSEPRLG